MKKVKGILLIAIFSLALLSCSKSIDPASVIGFWSGTYEVDGEEGESNWAFLFKENGTVRVFSGTTDTTSLDEFSIGIGTYTISGSVKATYSYSVSQNFSIKGNLVNDGANLEGTWTEVGVDINKGTFLLEKQD